MAIGLRPIALPLNANAVMKKKMAGIGLEVRFPGFLNAIAVIPGEDSNLRPLPPESRSLMLTDCF